MVECVYHFKPFKRIKRIEKRTKTRKSDQITNMQLRLQFDTLKTPQNLFYAQNTNLFQKKLKWATQGFVLELIKRSCMGRFYYAENVILLCFKFASMFHWGKFIIIFSIFFTHFTRF